MLQTAFYLKSTQREIGYSKCTPRLLQRHSKGTWALGHSGTRELKALGHLSTWGTLALEGHLGTQALRHSTLEALYSSNSPKTCRHKNCWISSVWKAIEEKTYKTKKKIKKKFSIPNERLLNFRKLNVSFL